MKKKQQQQLMSLADAYLVDDESRSIVSMAAEQFGVDPTKGVYRSLARVTPLDEAAWEALDAMEMAMLPFSDRLMVAFAMLRAAGVEAVIPQSWNDATNRVATFSRLVMEIFKGDAMKFVKKAVLSDMDVSEEQMMKDIERLSTAAEKYVVSGR